MVQNCSFICKKILRGNLKMAKIICKSWSKEKVLLKLLSKALSGLWTTDWAATNQMTIPFNKLPCTPPNSWTRQMELQSFLNVNGNRTSNKLSQQSNRKKTPRKKSTPINPWFLFFYVWICGSYYKFSTPCYHYFFG